jgi:hypothetical protein
MNDSFNGGMNMSAHPFGIEEQRYVIDAQEGDSNAAAHPSTHPLAQTAAHVADRPAIAYMHEGAMTLFQLGELE